VARMRRINIVIDPALDDRLEHEAAARGMSKSALVRACVEDGLAPREIDNGLLRIGALSPLFDDVEPVDIDSELYGPLEADS
jgi:Ribbon-helix-helix protein, copG family